MEDDQFLGDDAFLTPEVLGEALASSGLAVWRVDLGQRRVRMSAAAKRMLGLGASDDRDYDGLIALIHPDDRGATRTVIANAMAPESAGYYEAAFRLGAATAPTWFAVRGRVLFEGDGADRRACVLIGTLRDITERKIAEAAYQAAIDQQRELLHDVNHRVKNSLQLVSSLLRLQAKQVADAATRHQLEDATARISIIAHIHERLYRDQDINRIRFGAFVNELCSDLQGAAPLCSLKVQSPEFLVATESAIPLALAISELVTNAFTYAYPGAGGPVAVTIEQPSEGALSVSVADQGVGLPEGFSVAGAKTLGMVLVSSMVRQLSGHLDVHNGPRGVTFVIRARVGDVEH
jgi:PAS domain S-box-containing protein